MRTNIIQRLLKNPDTQNRDERRFIIVLLVFSIIPISFFLTFDSGTFGVIKPILSAFDVLAIISLFFAFKNLLNPARILVPIAGFIVVTLLLIMGGIHDDAIGGYYFLLIITTLLLGRLGLLIIGLCSTIAIIIIGKAETSGMITTHFGPLTDPSTIITSTFFMVGASLAMFFFAIHLSKMVKFAHLNEQKQKRANRKLIKLQNVLEKRVKDRTAELQALFASMKDLVIIYNKDGRYLNIATTDSRLLIKPPGDLIGRTIHEVFPKLEADRFLGHIRSVLETQETMPIEYFLEIDNRKVWFDASVSPMKKDTVIWVARDITDRKLMEVETRFMGTHDLLTKIYNRNFFEEELARLEKSRLFPVSIFMVDLDHLKTINDSQGHAAGDEILKRTAQVLQDCFRPEDMVARIGGDEFAILLPMTTEKAAHEALKRINHCLNQDNQKNKNKINISVGLAICEKPGPLAGTFKLADDRMYVEKRSNA